MLNTIAGIARDLPERMIVKLTLLNIGRIRFLIMPNGASNAKPNCLLVGRVSGGGVSRLMVK